MSPIVRFITVVFSVFLRNIVLSNVSLHSTAASAAGSETHSNSSGASSGGSKSELVKETTGGVIMANGRTSATGSAHVDAVLNAARKNSDGSQKIASLRFHQNGAMKLDPPIAEITYTRACDLQSRKPSIKVYKIMFFTEK